MKKILSLLGSSLITVSPATLLVSCTTPKVKLNEISMKTITEQVAKAAYLEKKSDYDFNYQLDEILKVKRIKDVSTIFSTNVDDQITAYSRVGELFDKYVDYNLFVKDYELKDGIKPKEASSIETLFVTLPNLVEMLSDGKIINFLFNSVLVLPEITNVLRNNYLVGYLDKILSTENTELLVNAFSNDKYANFTNQEVMNSAIMGLSNAIDFMLGNSNKINVPKKEQSSGKEFLASIDKLTKNLTAIRKKEKTLSLDLIRDLPAIAEIIRFARTLIVYTSQGVASLSSDTSNGNYFKEIDEFRKAYFNVKDNNLNIISLIYLLVDTFNDGSGIRKILAVLFQSYETPNIKNGLIPNVSIISNEKIYETGLTPIIQSIFNSFMPTLDITTGVPLWLTLILKVLKIDRINIGSIFNEIIVTIVSNNSFKEMIDVFNNILVINQISNKEIKDKIKSLKQTALYKEQSWTSLFEGNFINDLLKLLNKETGNQINIKSILKNTKISFLGSELSITEIFLKIKNTDIGSRKLLLDFENISNLIKDLRSILDLNNGIKHPEFIYKNFVDNLASIIENLSGIKKLTNWITVSENGKPSILDEYKQDQKQLKTDIYDNLYNLKVTSVNKLSDYSYEALIGEQTFKVNYVLNKKNKLQIKSIN
ncbi:hypothetical protein [Spiroplasma sp. BIUS-1]|uniref:hypothetical protein n=1 Tax=Spiroplasma sp. BIUS-1 TaxID=216964 RepID=UPI0013993693|nr:hypothetical protein [Spiroplasma sp. BIUS-1]QHX36603.1 MOLPALP family lipoprotein [Spiroplasma sp. BIUS-1]